MSNSERKKEKLSVNRQIKILYVLNQLKIESNLSYINVYEYVYSPLR